MDSPIAPQVDQTFADHVAQRRPMPFSHGLAEHPLMAVDALAGLAGRLGADSVSVETGSKPVLTSAPAFMTLDAQAIADQLRTLTTNDAWFTLLNVEQDPAYGLLVEQILDGIADRAALPRTVLRRRMGFVFASSPGSVTPAHFDIEHSLLLQVRGRRTLSFGRFRSDEDREREIGRYWNGGTFGRLETMPEPVDEIRLEPGVGAYIPPYTPHWLSNGDEASTSLTVTFFERSNEDESRVQVLNERLRRLGIEPTPYGRRPGRDRAKARVMGWYAGLQRRDSAPVRR